MAGTTLPVTGARQTAPSMVVTGNTSHTRPENRAFYPALDGVRAFAFLAVFGAHYLSLPWAWGGVDLFFVLSGFLITGILFDTRDDSFRVRNFYVRRTLRIFPLYYGSMLLVVLLQPVMHWDWNWRWLLWPAYLGNYAPFLHPGVPGDAFLRFVYFQPEGHLGRHQVVLFLGHFWSLCVEEQFYLVWPWLVFWIRDRRRLLWMCAAALPLCLVLRIAGYVWLPNWMMGTVLYRATPFRLDALLMGGLLALLLRGPHAPLLLRFSRRALPVALGVCALLLLCSPTPVWHMRIYHYPSWQFTWGLTLVDILSALLIIAAIQPESRVYRVFKARPLR